MAMAGGLLLEKGDILALKLHHQLSLLQYHFLCSQLVEDQLAVG
jgi:hypothetical protein